LNGLTNTKCRFSGRGWHQKCDSDVYHKACWHVVFCDLCCEAL